MPFTIGGAKYFDQQSRRPRVSYLNAHSKTTWLNKKLKCSLSLRNRNQTSTLAQPVQQYESPLDTFVTIILLKDCLG